MNENEWYDELAKFLAENNRHGWAADERRAQPLFPEWKRHVYRSADGLWLADDNYVGSIAAPGFTVVNFKERPSYMVQYGGPGLLAGYDRGAIKDQVIEHLKKALRQSTPEMPWRGPSRLKGENRLVYTFEVLREPRERHEVLAEERVMIGRNTLAFWQFVMGSLVLGTKKPNGEKDFPWNF